MRGIVRSGLALLAAILLLTPATASAQQPPRKIVLLMDWLIGGKHALFYPAVEKGFYRAEGLDVEIRRGTGSEETLQAVDQGHADFGFADAGVLVLKVAQGARLTYLGTVFDNQPLQFFAFKSANITSPKDFIGKRYGVPLASMSGQLFPAFMRLNGLDASKVNVVNIEAASTVAAFFSGQVDFTGGYSNSGTPIAWATAAKEGRELVTIPAGRYGLDIYSNGIVVANRTLEKDPELVARFMRATYRGLQYAAENPDETLANLFKRHPEIRAKEIARAQFREALKDFLTDAALANGLGYVDPAKWKRTRDVIVEGYNITTDLPADRLHTAKYLPIVKLGVVPRAFLDATVFGRY